jgi:hypothetical protein
MTTGQKIAPVAAETICVTQPVDRRSVRRSLGCGGEPELCDAVGQGG